MRIITLDGKNWKTISDFYDALLAAIGAPSWHGDSPDALIDSMIWGGINALEPPYTVRISGVGTLPKDVSDEVERAKWAIGQGRKDYQKQEGGDIEVAIEIEP
jgi:hypothetical protein